MGTFGAQRRGIPSFVFGATSKGNGREGLSSRESVERLSRAAILLAATLAVLAKLFAFGAFAHNFDPSDRAVLSSDKAVASIICDNKGDPAAPHHHRTHEHCVLCLVASADGPDKFTLVLSRITLAFAPQEALFTWNLFADPERTTAARVNVNPARAPPASAA